LIYVGKTAVSVEHDARAIQFFNILWFI